MAGIGMGAGTDGVSAPYRIVRGLSRHASAQTLRHPETEMPDHRIKIPVIVKKLVVALNAEGSNDHVYGLPYCDPTLS